MSSERTSQNCMENCMVNGRGEQDCGKQVQSNGNKLRTTHNSQLLWFSLAALADSAWDRNLLEWGSYDLPPGKVAQRMTFAGFQLAWVKRSSRFYDLPGILVSVRWFEGDKRIKGAIRELFVLSSSHSSIQRRCCAERHSFEAIFCAQIQGIILKATSGSGMTYTPSKEKTEVNKPKKTCIQETLTKETNFQILTYIYFILFCLFEQ